MVWSLKLSTDGQHEARVTHVTGYRSIEICPQKAVKNYRFKEGEEYDGSESRGNYKNDSGTP